MPDGHIPAEILNGWAADLFRREYGCPAAVKVFENGSAKVNSPWTAAMADDGQSMGLRIDRGDRNGENPNPDGETFNGVFVPYDNEPTWINDPPPNDDIWSTDNLFPDLNLEPSGL